MGKNKNLSAIVEKSHSTKYIPPNASVSSNGYYQLKPSWKFSEAWRGDPKTENVEFYGLAEIKKQGQHIIENLVEFESMQWKEILVTAKKLNHEMEVSSLSKGAQKVIQKFQPNLINIVSLRFSGEERLFGKIDNDSGAFFILFWDPHHKICPSSLKHT